MNKKTIITILFVLIFGAGFWFLYNRFSYTIKNSEDFNNLIYLSLIICAVFPSMLNYKAKELVKGFLAFFSLMIILFIIYTYQGEILNSKFISELIPSRAVISKNGNVILTAGINGHFQTEVVIDNYKIECLVDTGASEILIDPDDAAEIGMESEKLNYNIKSYTANGVGYAARANIRQFSVGNIKLTNVPVLINQVKLGSCLLGMSFLNRLGSFTIKGDQLIMVP